MPKVIIDNEGLHEEVEIVPHNWFGLLNYAKTNQFISDTGFDTAIYKVEDKWVVEKRHQTAYFYDDLEDALTDFIERVKGK